MAPIPSILSRLNAHTREQFLNLHVCLSLHFVFVYLFKFSILCIFCVNADHFIPLLFVFVVLGLVFLVPSQGIGWVERL